MQKGYEISPLQEFWVNTEAFILMSAILYIIAIIFQRGVALQQEHDLTV